MNQTQFEAFEAAQFARLDQLFNGEVQKNHLAEAAITVQHKGKTIFTNFYGGAKPKSIYKIYSMTKPITAVAVMMLLEQGLIDLNDDISWYLPQMKKENLFVFSGAGSSDSGASCAGAGATSSGSDASSAEPDAASTDKGAPAASPITIRQLLNMTSGLCYPDSDPIGIQVSKLQTQIQQRISNGEHLDNLQIAQLLGTTPLKFHPGTDWQYGTSADILGALIEAVSGMEFGQFLKQNIFAPLNMSDTWFSVPEENLSRLVKPKSRKQDGHLEDVTPEVLDWLGQTHPEKPVQFQSGGGYLYSTLEDYSRFADMLVNGGTSTITGARILSRKTISFMSTNQLTQKQLSSFWLSQEGYGYANLMRTMIHPELTGCGSVGEFGWDGLAGTYFLIDPKEELAVVYMQQIKEGGDPILRRKFRNIIYSSLL